VKYFIICYFHLAARDRLKEAYPIVLAQNKAFTAETPLPGPASAGRTRRRNATEKGELERKTILELLQSTSSCGTDFNLPIRQCKAALCKAGRQAWLRVNLAQTSAFRPGSRKVHILYFPKSSGFMSEIRDFSSSSSSKRLDAKTPICFVDEMTDSAT